mmetsp:Transcript_64291/g.139049  ORF Transcript_64291/g.139049 Transcript_64291/m.139049 type:complete len:196 (-) Transcript_64291:49-636(-)
MAPRGVRRLALLGLATVALGAARSAFVAPSLQGSPLSGRASALRGAAGQADSQDASAAPAEHPWRSHALAGAAALCVFAGMAGGPLPARAAATDASFEEFIEIVKADNARNLAAMKKAEENPLMFNLEKAKMMAEIAAALPTVGKNLDKIVGDDGPDPMAQINKVLKDEKGNLAAASKEVEVPDKTFEELFPGFK